MGFLDDKYVKDLEETIERQQVSVDKFTNLIKRLDKLNIKISFQDASNLIKPDAFVRWMNCNTYWTKVSEVIDAGELKRIKYRYRDGSRETIIECPIKKGTVLDNRFYQTVRESFLQVWDFWLRDHNGSGLVSLIVEILEQEE